MRKLFLIAMLVTSVPFATTQAATADVAKPVKTTKTVKTKCSDSNSATINCANTGQRGKRRAMEMAWPDTRFTVGTKATADCVTDNLTGLMWMRTPETLGVGKLSTALAKAKNINLCGFTDWRLATVREFETLINNGSANRVADLPDAGFSLRPASTSNLNPSQRSTSNVWVITHTKGKTITGYSFWPVRGG